MRVIINGLSALKSKTGVGHHVTNLHAALTAQFPNDSFDRYPGQWVLQRRQQPASDSTPNRRQSRTTDWSRRLAKELLPYHFAAYTNTFPYDLYHEPNFISFRSSLPTVLTVHDLSVWKFPHWHPKDRVRVHQRHFESSIRRANRIIVVSNTIRDELLRTFSIKSGKVHVIPNGIDIHYHQSADRDISRVRGKYSLPERYFLCIGTIEPRKNLLTVMRAFTQLPTHLTTEFPLMLAGPWGWRSDDERAFYESQLDTGNIRHLGYVDDADMPALYQSARALLYPSHYEGFGLPIIEMLAGGGTVIASDIPVHREIAGSHATLLPTDDLDAWMDAIRQMIQTNDDKPNPTSQEWARQYNWNRNASLTYALYQDLLSRLT